jgi:hypothetical protein
VALASHPGEEIRGSLIRMRRHPEREDLLRAVRSLSDAQTHPEALL